MKLISVNTDQDLRIFTKYSRFGDWGLVIGEWEKSLNHQHFGTI
jgi:hypothetical protein